MVEIATMSLGNLDLASLFQSTVCCQFPTFFSKKKRKFLIVCSIERCVTTSCLAHLWCSTDALEKKWALSGYLIGFMWLLVDDVRVSVLCISSETSLSFHDAKPVVIHLLLLPKSPVWNIIRRRQMTEPTPTLFLSLSFFFSRTRSFLLPKCFNPWNGRGFVSKTAGDQMFRRKVHQQQTSLQCRSLSNVIFSRCHPAGIDFRCPKNWLSALWNFFNLQNRGESIYIYLR